MDFVVHCIFRSMDFTIFSSASCIQNSGVVHCALLINTLIKCDVSLEECRGAGATGAAAPLPFVDGGSGGNFALCS